MWSISSTASFVPAPHSTQARSRRNPASRTESPTVEADDDAAEIIDELKDFIENVSPEDFGS
jgi:hypothetical protein